MVIRKTPSEPSSSRQKLMLFGSCGSENSNGFARKHCLRTAALELPDGRLQPFGWCSDGLVKSARIRYGYIRNSLP